MNEDKVLTGIDLSIASRDLIELLIGESTEPAIFEQIVKANMNRPEILETLLNIPDIPEYVRNNVSNILNVPSQIKAASTQFHKHPEERKQTLLQRIQKLSVSERILLALRGSKEARSILLRDANKEVSMNVLENPKITETEVEAISRSRSISDEALRKVTKKREWMKNYNIVLALVTNPKTPAGIAVNLVSELKTKDLVVLEKNRNVAEGVRITAKKLLRARKGGH
ncbi:MAG: hypothetical protein IBX72_15690 [Nitrospirae bacterium]|jgi:hypothetical protein|nr:hypothetical protein [Nitrospirota bacterium]